MVEAPDLLAARVRAASALVELREGDVGGVGAVDPLTDETAVVVAGEARGPDARRAIGGGGNSYW